MYKIISSQYFKKKYRKIVTNNKILATKIDAVLQKLASDPYQKPLKTHKVDSKLAIGVYSSRVTGDIRIIWEQLDCELVLLLLDIGGHSGGSKVYK
ncbi:MAG: type II toxin-antitoxin system mRNA interferase toxin, RelE/StbE family [Candidatus Melainabacteria bacterium]|nr:type II toxin-antitoxin system mRNA interferase toxin, RelE/StbE family [Candidatus Melainabacteria bacterium]